MRVQERSITTADGLTVFAREYPAEPPQTGLPVLCLHGLTRNSRDFELLAPRIAALGRRVITPDVRGRGRSDRDPQPLRYNPGVYAQDTLRVLDACEVEEAVWIGTSMGGIMTLLAGQFAANRIAAVVLNDIGPVIDPSGLARIGGYVGQVEPFESWEAAAAAIQCVQGHAFPDADAGFWASFARRTCRELEDGRVGFDYDPAIAEPFKQPAGAAPADMWALFDALGDTSVLVVRGETSDILSRETVAAMRARRPDLESVEVPRVGHAPTLEEDAAWTAVLDFLARAP